MLPDSKLSSIFADRLSLRLYTQIEQTKFFVTHTSADEVLLESFGLEGELLLLNEDGFSLHRKFIPPAPKHATPFAGCKAAEVFDSGSDVLGSALLGHPLEDYRGLLPDISEGAYLSLGYHASVRALTVDMQGRVYLNGPFHGEWHAGSHPAPDFSPEELGLCCERLGLLDGELPLLFGLFRLDGEPCEVSYLTEIADITDDSHGYVTGDAALWLRVIRYGETNIRVEHYAIGLTGERLKRALAGDLFADCLTAELLYYNGYIATMANITLPDEELNRAYHGCILNMDGLFSGEARYGSRYYAFETHKNFPPNWITSLLTLCNAGKCSRARLLYDQFLTHSVDEKGRIHYRQGKAQYPGASGSEYGQLLWVFGRYREIFAPQGETPEHLQTIRNMAKFLTKQISLSPVAGVPLVRMCAEADSNERIYDYLQNTLWAIRGLESAAAILRKDGEFAKAAAITLRESMDAVCRNFRTETKWGPIIPFHLGYPAVPLTLSRCGSTSEPISEENLRLYYEAPWDGRSHIKVGQEYFENTYSNYRYYGEMLSSGLLPEEIAKTIRRMRSEIGGELLSMTRFAGWLDDWPVWNYALDALEAGENERFYQLLCAHTLFHGLPEFHTYYEQVRHDDKHGYVMGDQSIGCLLAPPLLICMGLAYEMHDGSLALLRGVPEHVLRRGLSFSGLHACGGTVGVTVEEGRICVALKDISCQVHLSIGDKTIELDCRKTSQCLTID